MASRMFNLNPKQAKRARIAAQILYTLICIIVMILVLIPLLVLLINVTRTKKEILTGFQFMFGTSFADNFKAFMDFMDENKFNPVLSFFNSVFISLASTAVCVYFSAMAAYAIHIYDFRGKKFFERFILMLIIIPNQLGAVGFYTIAKQYLNISPAINQTYLAYAIFILPAIASASTVYFLRQYMKNNFSLEYVDAARMDGASEFKIFNTICLPFIKSPCATMALFGIIASWNNFMGPLTFLDKGQEHLYTFPQLAYYIGKEASVDVNAQYMGIFITALPMLLVYIVMNRIIMKGTAAGGLK